MQVKTIKQFAENSNIPESLIRAVIRQFGGWKSFKESYKDVVKYGIDEGFHGFIYYKDMVAFTKRNKESILWLCKDWAEQIGEGGIISFISTFGCLKGETQEDIADGLYNHKSDNQTLIYNALAWFAAEEVCRSYNDLVNLN